MSSRRNQRIATSSDRGYPRARGGWRGRSRGDAFHASTSDRRMENIASVSRSSGLEKDGDALKDFKTQEEYREFIQGKLDSFHARYPDSRGHETDSQQRLEVQENILILFRKLREGLVASKRSDGFTLEVYETSLYLATMFINTKQINSIVPQLIPDLYVRIPEPHHNRLLTILISLLLQLLLGYPSQSLYRQLLRSISESMLPSRSKARTWITSVSASLRTQNFARFETLTRSESFRSFLDDPPSLPDEFETLSISARSNRDLARKTFYSLIDEVRAKPRETSWTILRTAYREFSCLAESGTTRDWLVRSLALQKTSPDCESLSLDQWLDEKNSTGHIRRKEGVEGRWIISKIQR